MDSSITLIIKNTMDNVQLVGAAVRSIAAFRFKSRKDCDFIETAIVEALTNVVKHAYNRRPDKKIEIKIELKPTHISYTIIDEGYSYDPNQAKPFEFDPTDFDNLPEGGMGIYIFNKIMDQVQYVSKSGKNELKLVKYVQHPN